jgi:hypothetical protein
LSGYFLLPNLFSFVDIFAASQKHTGHHSIIITTGEATKIHSSHNNAIANILAKGKPNGLINNSLNGTSKVVILTFGDTEKSQLLWLNQF